MSALLGYFGLPGGVEILVLLAVILLLFGNRLPGAMRSLGRSVVEFKKGVHDNDEGEEPARVEGDTKKEATG